MTAILAIGFLGAGLFGLVAAAALALSAFMADPTIPGPQDEQLRLDAAAGAAATTQTSSTNSAAIDMGSAFAPAGMGQPVAGIVQVTAADRADSNETYNFKLQESSDNSTFTDVSVNVAVPVSGTTATTGTLVCKGFVTKRYVRLASTLAGTTPSVTFKAWLRPLKPAA